MTSAHLSASIETAGVIGTVGFTEFLLAIYKTNLVGQGINEAQSNSAAVADPMSEGVDEPMEEEPHSGCNEGMWL